MKIMGYALRSCGILLGAATLALPAVAATYPAGEYGGAPVQMRPAPLPPAQDGAMMAPQPSAIGYGVESPWHRPPQPRAPAVPPAPVDPLQTVTSAQIGAQFGKYHYQEPDLGVTLDGLKYAFTARGTVHVYDNFFFGADGRIAYGADDYKGTGKHNDEPTWTSEIRGYAGYDFLFGGFAVSPYLGVGYRYLYNDARGLSTTGGSGYRRESEYLYAPVGVNPRIKVGDQDILSATLEYDHLIEGRQHSRLSDVLAAYGDVTDRQNGGYGVRGDLMYQHGRWSFGPYFNYWNINQSNFDCSSTGAICGDEPHNQTTEVGAQFRYQVY